MVATTRFSSGLFSADDVTCTATRHTRAEEEVAALPTVVFPRRGVFLWHSGSVSILAEPNTVLLFDPREPHRITHPTDSGDDCTALRFLPEQIHDALGDAGCLPRFWILDAHSQLSLHLAMQTIRTSADMLQGEEAAMAILRTLARSSPTAVSPHRAVEIVRERIAADPSQCATLADLAGGTGLSPFELARRFRASTGSSIHQYRLRLRLLLALSALRDGEEDLTSLALDLGFSSHAHFTTTFARMLKIQPRMYRLMSHRS